MLTTKPPLSRKGPHWLDEASARLSLAIRAFLLAFTRCMLIIAWLWRGVVVQSVPCRVDVYEKLRSAVERRLTDVTSLLSCLPLRLSALAPSKDPERGEDRGSVHSTLQAC